MLSRREVYVIWDAISEVYENRLDFEKSPPAEDAEYYKEDIDAEETGKVMDKVHLLVQMLDADFRNV